MKISIVRRARNGPLAIMAALVALAIAAAFVFTPVRAVMNADVQQVMTLAANDVATILVLEVQGDAIFENVNVAVSSANSAAPFDASTDASAISTATTAVYYAAEVANNGQKTNTSAALPAFKEAHGDAILPNQTAPVIINIIANRTPAPNKEGVCCGAELATA